MRLFCSTKPDDQLRPPLPSARKFSHSAGFDIWSIDLPIFEFLDKVSVLLANRAIVSACVLNEPPLAGKEWLFFEWHGKLLIDLALVNEVLRDAGQWQRTQVREELNIAVFEPADSSSNDFAAQAVRYRRLLADGEKSEVILRREWLETDDALRTLFGEYADPKIGGAVALLSMSGAVSSDAPAFTLRTPAALDLDVERSHEGLVADAVRNALTIRCVGFSNLLDLGQENFKTSRDRWRKLHEEACGSSPFRFFVALELDASVDPTIVIQRGTVFEQRTLIGVQTLAIARDERTIVDASEVKPLVIPAYCLNRDLRLPHGNPMRPTPFVYRRATGTQDDVWQARRGS